MVANQRAVNAHQPTNQTRTNSPRDASSYRRPKPTDGEVTSEHHHAIDSCHHCGGSLTDKQEYTRFIEDIILAALGNLQQFKTVEKQTIERGWCVGCGKYSSAADLRGQDVSLGPNVRSLVCYLITLKDHGYKPSQNKTRHLACASAAKKLFSSLTVSTDMLRSKKQLFNSPIHQPKKTRFVLEWL